MATEPGNTFGRARNLGVLNRARTLTDSVSNADKLDIYRFRLAGSTNLSSLVRGVRANVELALFNGQRQAIATSNQFGRVDGAIDAVLDAGTYFIRVGVEAGRTNYRLRLRAAAFTPPPDGAGNTAGMARAIALSPSPSAFSDFVGTADTDDFYSVNVTTASNLNLALDSLGANANVQVLNSSGAIVASSTNEGTIQDAINLNLGTGSYAIRVFQRGRGANTAYNLNLSLNPLRLIAATADNSLIAFSPDRPGNAFRIGSITGLSAGDSLVGIDFRPASGRLFGVGRTNQLYTIDVTTGAATPFGTPFPPPLNGTSFGVDFNPVPNRFRVVSDANQNFRLNPDEATGTVTLVDGDAVTAGIQPDPDLTFDSTDPNAGRERNIVATAYQNNRADASTTPQLTTQFGIDSDLDILVRQGSPTGSPISPNAGRLFTVGSLGFDFGSDTSFDIMTDANRIDTAFATTGANLFSINLTTGAATSLGIVSLNGFTPLNVLGLSATL